LSGCNFRDVKLDEVKQLAEKYWETIPAGPKHGQSTQSSRRKPEKGKYSSSGSATPYLLITLPRSPNWKQ